MYQLLINVQNYADVVYGWSLTHSHFKIRFFIQMHCNIQHDMRLFVDFCVYPRFSLNLPEQNLKLFCTAEENNFRFSAGEFKEKGGKTQKSINNLLSSFGWIEKIWICLLFIKLYFFHLLISNIYFSREKSLG